MIKLWKLISGLSRKKLTCTWYFICINLSKVQYLQLPANVSLEYAMSLYILTTWLFQETFWFSDDFGGYIKLKLAESWSLTLYSLLYSTAVVHTENSSSGVYYHTENSSSGVYYQMSLDWRAHLIL